ncbi:hypothetical protein HY639_02655 [Candidatus Woesearchaeota archaeon]|nr:hypothetical protein [Candidatus Woesearchaeota archaeon]
MELIDIVEVKAVFDDKVRLENLCRTLLGTITGCSIHEQEATYLWQGNVVTAKNYVATTLVPLHRADAVYTFLYDNLALKWQVPLVQVSLCKVPRAFAYYLASV